MKKFLLFIATFLMVANYANAQGYATVTLTAGDVWEDGTGYQMLLDPDAYEYGVSIPEYGPLYEYYNATYLHYIYDEFEYKIPENADWSLTTSNIVLNNSVTITIPAGTYDWCITNPTPGSNGNIWIAASNGNIGGRANDFVFEAGNTYEFIVTYNSALDQDQVDLVINGEQSNTYDIQIVDTYVTDDNKDGVTGEGISGTITFDPATATLTLNNATVMGAITINHGVASATDVVNPVIKLIGENIVYLVDLEYNYSSAVTGLLTICGNGSMKQTEGIHLQEDINLLVKDCTLEMETEEAWCTYGYTTNVFTFNNANASFKITSYDDNPIPLGDFAELNLIDCEIVTPANAQILRPNDTFGYFIFESDGTTPASEVVIRRTDGIAQNEATSINVHPNPASDILFIENANDETVKVYDNMGRVVIEKRNSNGTLDVSGLAQGIYAINVGSQTIKFVKK